jgi:hypothetical protein
MCFLLSTDEYDHPPPRNQIAHLFVALQTNAFHDGRGNEVSATETLKSVRDCTDTLSPLGSGASQALSNGARNCGEAHAEAQPMHGRDWSLRLLLPPLATLIFTFDGGSA